MLIAAISGVSWVMAAGLCAFIAKEQKRSVGTHAAIGLLFGVFWVAALALMGPVKPPAQAAAPTQTRKPDISADFIRKI